MNQSAMLDSRESPAEEMQPYAATAQHMTPSLDDQRLAERVERALRSRGYWALHLVRVSVRMRVIYLGGRVCSYYLKQLAQETALAVPGSDQIRNDLRVEGPK
jgi:osmotically-inducible protein OsmY